MIPSNKLAIVFLKMSHSRLTLLMCIAASAASIVSVARADFAILDLRSNVGSPGGQSPVVGWEFKPTVPIAVTKLGFYDEARDGLVTSHDIGVFDADSRTLLVSNVINAGTSSPIEGPLPRLFAPPTFIKGGFRYVSVPETILTPGHNYVIAATAAGAIDQQVAWGPSAGYLLETASEISFVQGRFGTPGPFVLSFPTTVAGNANFGPSFQFVVVPEPSSFLLCCLGATIAVAARYQHKRRSKRLSGLTGIR